jgi:hypothetical protein
MKKDSSAGTIGLLKGLNIPRMRRSVQRQRIEGERDPRVNTG